jgi:hypothetical protein
MGPFGSWDRYSTSMNLGFEVNYDDDYVDDPVDYINVQIQKKKKRKRKKKNTLLTNNLNRKVLL